MKNIYSKEDNEIMLPVLEKLCSLVVKEIEETGCKVLKINPVVNEYERGYSYTVKVTSENFYSPLGNVTNIFFKEKEILGFVNFYSCTYAVKQLATQLLGEEEASLKKTGDPSSLFDGQY
jgi:hypothetical protein